MTLAANQQVIECTSSDQLFVDRNGGLRSTRFDDIYFHPTSGAEESQYVFLDGNKLSDRWSSSDASAELSSNSNFIIAETGFGTGLNFLACWDLWRKCFAQSATKKTLYFYSTERYPLSYAALEKALAHYNPFPELSQALLQQYPDAIGGDYLLEFDIDSKHRVKLILLFGDVKDCLQRLEHYPLPSEAINTDSQTGLLVDAWFLDGFSPPKNPAMWQESLFSLIAKYSSSNTTVATFSVARQVRDQLSDNGFALQKIPGFASKRDMLTARYKAPAEKHNASANVRGRAENKSALAPCYYRFSSKHFYDRCFSKDRHTKTALNQQEQQPAKKTALVIGAGIAGCSIAYKLAKENWQVELVDTADTIAAAASGNARAVLYARTAKQRSSLADFHEAAFHYAVNFYSGFNSDFYAEPNTQLGLNGMLKLDEQISEQLIAANPELRSRQNVNAELAKQLAGIDTQAEGIFYPQSGCLDPVAICTQLTAEENIYFHGNTAINKLKEDEAGWQAEAKNQSNFKADIIVIACGQHSNQFTQSQWLPLKSLRGQTSELPSSKNSQALNIAVCHRGYITPQQNGLHSIGATYSADNNSQVLKADHKVNIDNLLGMLDDHSDWKAALGENNDNLADTLNGRVGFRCVSPDYMPIVGPLLNEQVFNQQFNHLSKDASKIPDTMATLHDGLFVSTGFGSHGFTTAPLAAELLLAQIEATPMPLGDKLRQSIAPVRFLTRKLVRGKPAAVASDN